MRILNVNHLLDPVSGGGTAERTIQLTRSLLQKRVDCEILTLAVDEVDISEKKLPKVHWLPCVNQRFFIPIVRLRQVNRLISEFDVVHLMGHWTLLNAVVAMTCIYQKTPYVVCPAGALKNFGRSRWLKRIYDFVIGKRIISSASAWVAITEDEKFDFSNYRIPPKSVVVIPNGVDPIEYELNESCEKNSILDEQLSLNGQPYILFLGRLNKIKGPDLLLEAFATITENFPSLHLVFAGPDSGLMNDLKSYALEMGINERVHFAGYVAGEKKINALYHATCLVIPSREEAMSIVVLEAGMCGTPVIFTDRCGLDDLAEKDAGIQVEATADSIRQGLIEAITAQEKMHESAKRLKKIVCSDFLWSNQAERYLALYKEIVG